MLLLPANFHVKQIFGVNSLQTVSVQILPLPLNLQDLISFRFQLQGGYEPLTRGFACGPHWRRVPRPSLQAHSLRACHVFHRASLLLKTFRRPARLALCTMSPESTHSQRWDYHQVVSREQCTVLLDAIFVQPTSLVVRAKTLNVYSATNLFCMLVALYIICFWQTVVRDYSCFFVLVVSTVFTSVP